MAKHFKKNGKGPVNSSKYRHLKESGWDLAINCISDFFSDFWEELCSVYFEVYEKISEKISSLSLFSPKDTYQSKHGVNDNPKIIDFNEQKFKRARPDSDSESETKSYAPVVFNIKPLKRERLQREKLEEKKDFNVLKGLTLKREKTRFSGKLPTSQQLEAELRREHSKRDNSSLVRNTVFSLITISAVVVLIAIFVLPVFQIYGTSMQPNFKEGDILVSVKGAELEKKDVISFYYNNKILVKRVIAFEGDYVNIDESGNVYVNDQLLDEPYLRKKALGECDIEFPYQVPAGKIFVLGDYRETSVDSRNKVMGCVSEEQIIGEIIFRVWPIDRFGTI
ncbi:MAG: signal peptidase I [Ruminococcus sp.]|nr:signal peptidase I [Ruminococcus sp.]